MFEKICRSSLFGGLLAAQMFLTFQTEAVEPAQSDGTCGKSHARPMRVTIRHIEAGGIGYNQGYTTLEGFFSPIHSYGAWVPFLDLRGHVFNNGKLAANTGIGVRYIYGSRIYGVNAYYDYRNTSHQHYNQISAGLETLGKLWDLRINGYLPVGNKISPFYHTEFEGFDGFSAILSRKREVALAAANAEVGFHVDHFEDFPLYFAAGPYYLTGKSGTAWGGEARAVVDIFEYVSLEGCTSYDSLFKWMGQGQLSFNIPFGPKRTVKPSKQVDCDAALCLSMRSLQRVDRNEIIPVDHQKIESKAIDPLTGDAYVIWFVDNTSHSAGTYESPFSTLAAAETASAANDIIYVFPGDQTTTGMAAGITLKNGQRLWGSAISHSLPTTFGTVQIPALSIGSFVNDTFGTSIALLPIITGSGDVVTLANNNEISGIYILNTAGDGIAGSSISNLTVVHSTIQGSSGSSISLTDVEGTLLIDSNSLTTNSANVIDMGNTTVNLAATISNNQILSGADGCAWALTTEGTLEFTGNSTRAESNAVNLTPGSGSTLVATVSNNQMEMFQRGVLLTAGGSDVTITMQSNSIDGGGSDPAIEIAQTTGSVTATVSGNQVANYGKGFLLSAGGSSATVTLQSNVIIPGGGNPDSPPAIEIDQTAGSLVASIISNQTVSAEQGILLNAGGSEATLSAKSNTITSYYGHGIDIEQTSGSLTASVAKNTIAAQDNNGFNYRNSADAGISATLAVTGNTIDGYQPIMVNQAVGTVAATVTSNVLTTNFDGPALTHILDAAVGTQTSIISNNTVTQSNGDGFDLFFYDAGSVEWNINHNTFYGVAGNAVRISTNGETGVDTSVCLKFNNNTAYPIRVDGDGTYSFDNTNNSGTFTLNPPVGNVGDFNDYTADGVVTGSCP